MYPLWEQIVEPALVAAGARRVIEIGALRGETTVRLLELLGPASEVHVIDPVPIFDPTEHARRFPGRYHLHRDISHAVLPELPPADAALVDGDHNWFTVYHELRVLREKAREEGAPLPLLVMHDVCWPYGRRDLYYAPERIPEEFRHPHRRAGILPGHRELVAEGGLNQQLENAVVEGGPRNGVMTALDDFAAEHDRPLRRVIVPIYYGLALVADQDLLEGRPELASLLDRWEGAEGRHELLELGESIRLREQIQHQGSYFAIEARAHRAAGLYLDLLKGALLDVHYLENELRIQHLLQGAKTGEAVNPKKLGDPVRYMRDELHSLRQERQAGAVPVEHPQEDGRQDGFAYTDIGRIRLDHLEQCLDTIREENVEGDLVECGTGRGGSGVFIRGYLQAYDLWGPRVWVADRFAGSGENDALAFPPDLNSVREAFSRFGLLDGRVTFLQGPPSQTLAGASIRRVALLRIDGDDPDDVRVALETLYDKLAVGGFVVIDDYGVSSCQAAVEEFRSERGIAEPLERIDWSGAWWRKMEHARRATSLPAPPEHGVDHDLATENGRPVATKDLSVVVVVYNMRREAERTLYSLSRKYQQGVDDLDYEVIVVENGSDPEQRLGEEFVRSFGAEFRYVDLGDEATPSPGPALNQGLGLSCGESFALMIDGAHVLTPGVLRLGMLGLSSYAPAVVTTQQWYVGPGEQNEAVGKGYDRDYEDRLFEQIRWPTDGYRLFQVGHFIGSRDWFEEQWESNCIFVPRSVLEQVGPMDESFSIPGGGFVNLDFFERVANSPGVNLVTILGEGSFHQVHGGTTTNIGEAGARRGLLDSYHDAYAELRGRQFLAPKKEFNYVGSLPEGARRTKPRRMGAPVYFKLAHVEGTDGRPPNPIPVPEELKTEFVDAFWRSKEWHATTWLGKWTNKAPTDLLVYQDLLFRVKPTWVVETGTEGGGRAFFLATVFDLMGEGRILSIDDRPVEKLAEHPRITYLRRDPTDESAATQVRELLGERPRVLLILGAAKRDQLLKAFELYSPLVPMGSYVVIEDTILNGHPVWTGFGPGPWEAAERIVDQGEFEIDLSQERYALTFNARGFLRRKMREER